MTHNPAALVERLRAFHAEIVASDGGIESGQMAMTREAFEALTTLTAERDALRLTLGGRTFSAAVPAPIGCPAPGACAQVAEIGRLRGLLRDAVDGAAHWRVRAREALEEVVDAQP